jgi:hypothetical protein
VDENPDPQIGILLELQLPDLDKPSRFVRVKCGTGRTFAVCVPDFIETAHEGQAWMSGLDVDHFTKPEFRA